MRRALYRVPLVCSVIAAAALLPLDRAEACVTVSDCAADLDEGAVTVSYEGAGVAEIAGATGSQASEFAWRLIDNCLASAEIRDYCSPTDIRQCPQVPNRVITYLVAQYRPVVRPDLRVRIEPGTEETTPAPAGFQPGQQVGIWSRASEGCYDITPLNPPPSPAEVFSYFQRLPLPTLATQHQPPGNGLSGLPVIFYTDSPTTQSFTVDIRGFTVVINAVAKSYTWHTGDSRTPVVTSADPGRAYPHQTIEHPYKSGTYTAYLTVTWGATFTVNGGPPDDVAGTTTTDGPPVTFDVLQARAVLTNPYD